jgi:hypothetical protein
VVGGLTDRLCTLHLMSGGDSGEDPDGEKEGKTNEMSGKTRCKVQYRRASTDLYRWGEPDQDVYVRKR